MKYSLFKKTLALFLSGTMLAGVGCKDYDDDINAINGRLDEMGVTVNGLGKQIEAVKSSIPSLDELNQKVAALTQELNGVKTNVEAIDQRINALGDVQSKLDALKSELQNYVDGSVQSTEETLRKELATKGEVAALQATIEGLKKEYDAQLATIGATLASLSAQVEALEAKITGVEAGGQAVDEAQSKDIEALKSLAADLKSRLEALATASGAQGAQHAEEIKKHAAAIEALTARIAALEAVKHVTTDDITTAINNMLSGSDSWTGSSLNDAIKAYLDGHNYIADAEYKSYDETLAALIETMKDKENDYTKNLIQFIKDNQNLTQAQVDQTVNQFKEDIQKQIEKINNRLFELEGRIQSLVYVAESAQEQASNYYKVGNVYYLKSDDGVEISIIKPSIEMQYMVSPASLAKKIKEAYDKDNKAVSFILRQLNNTRSADEECNITVDDVIVDESNNGMFLVKATINNYEKRELDENAWGKAKRMFVALNVKIANPTVTGGTEQKPEYAQGIDYTTSFTELRSNPTPINEGLRIGKNGEVDYEKWITYKENYDPTTSAPYSFHKKIKYTDTDRVNFLEGYEVYYTEDDVVYIPVAQKWPNLVTWAHSAFKKNAVVDPVDNKKYYTLEKDGFSIAQPSAVLINDEVISDAVNFTVTFNKTTYTVDMPVREIVSVDADGKEVTSAPVAFAWNAKNEYKAEKIQLPNYLTAKEYNEFKAASSVEVTVKGDDTIDALVTLTSTPTIDSDAQFIDVQLTGTTLAQKGTYTIEAKYTRPNGTYIAIEIPVTATGAPALELNITGEKMYIGTTADYLLQKDYISTLWEQVTDKKAFGEESKAKANFTEMVAEMLRYADQNDSEIYVWSMQNTATKAYDLYVDFSGTTKKVYTSNFELVHENGLVIPVYAEVELSAATAALKANPMFIVDGKATAIAKFSEDKTQYVVEDKALNSAFDYDNLHADLQGKVDIVYEVNADALKAWKKLNATATAPVITGNVLTWNGWNKYNLPIDVYAKFKNGGEIIESSRQTFDVVLPSPYLTGELTAQVGEFSLKAEGSTFNVASILTLNTTVFTTVDGKKVYDNVFDANGLVSSYNTALGNKVTYAAGFAETDALQLNEATGVITYKANPLQPAPSQITVTAKYTDKFGDTKTVTAKINLK